MNRIGSVTVVGNNENAFVSVVIKNDKYLVPLIAELVNEAKRHMDKGEYEDAMDCIEGASKLKTAGDEFLKTSHGFFDLDIEPITENEIENALGESEVDFSDFV